MLLTFALAIAGRDVHFINFLFVVYQQFQAENYLLNYESKYQLFVHLLGRRSGRKS